MGGVYSSKRDAAISPEDTKLLLGDIRHRRICNAYERISGGKGLDSKAFQIHVLGGFQRMPKFLADRIFFALDRAGKGILTPTDFVASMAVMLSSSPEAAEGRYLLLFRIYDIFQGGTLERASVNRVLFIAYPDIESYELTGAVDEFFGKNSVLAYEEFRSRQAVCTISKRAVGELLTGWFYTICDHLMDEPEPELVALEQRYNPERGLRKLASEHEIDDQTITELHMRHAVLCQQGVSGGLDPGVFCQVVDSVIHEDLALRIFSYYCSASRLRWTIYDFVNFCRFAVRGSFEEQQQLLFSLFDDDGDGILNQVEVELMLEALAWHHIHRNNKFAHQQNTPLCRTPYSSCNTGRRRSSSITGPHDKGDYLLDYGLQKIGYDAPRYDLAELSRNILKSAEEKSKQQIDNDGYGYEGSSSEFVRNNGLTLPGFISWTTEDSGRVQLSLDLCLITAAEFHMRPMNQQQEKRIIEDICCRYDASLVSETAAGFKYGPPGTWWALISTQWWTQWRLFVGYDNDMSEMSSLFSSFAIPPPGLIKNQVLLKGDLQLIALLKHGIDYDCLPPSAWECLQRWYGGGPSIQREVVRIPQPQHVNAMMNIGNDEQQQEEGLSRQSSVLCDFMELHPLLLKVTFCDAKGHHLRGGRYLLFSKFATGQDLLEHLSAVNKLEPERIRLWDYVDRADWHSQSLLDLQRTLLELGLSDYRLILVEVSQSNGSWPRSQLQSILEVAEEEGRKESSASEHNSRLVSGTGGDTAGSGSKKLISGYESNELGGVINQAPAPHIFGNGLTGMNNLGNTCYVNSSMQCLSHTPLLKDYFLNLNYLRDVNVENKMGQGGRLAQVYAELVQELWSPSKKTVTPKQFKTAIARFNDQFSGNDQHDAHDLLTFVLNGLNEDLNRIAEKPYIEQPDSDGRSDKELADIWWRNHLCRELSIVVALFGGQFKSLLTCQNCGYGSARFEPFLCLQLPLPEVSCRPVDVVLVPLPGSLCPLHCVVEVPRTGTIWDTAVALVEMLKSLPKGSESRSSPQSTGSRFDDEDMEDIDSKISDEEELSPYGYLELRPEDLVIVDTAPEQVFSIFPMYRKLSTIKDKKVLYFYQLERNTSSPLAVDRVFDNGTAVVKSNHPANFASTAATQETSHSSELVNHMDVDAEPESRPSLDDTEIKESSTPSRGGTAVPALDPWPDISAAETEYAIGVSYTTGFDTTRTTEAQQLNQHEATPRLNQGYPHSSSPTTTTTGLSTHSLPTRNPPNQSIFYVIHRSLERTNIYFFNYFRLQLLAMPLVCSLDSQKPLTGIELYDWLASRFERFIKDPVHISSMHKGSKGRKLVYRPSSSRSSLTLESFKNMDWSETCIPSHSGSFSSHDDVDKRYSCGPTRATSSRIAAGHLNQWGFRLTWVTRNGTACGKCNWMKGCVGCLIPPNNEAVKLKHGDTVAVDWHISIMKERYDGVEVSRKVVHSSVRNSQRLENFSLSLERCMDEFTAEEIIPEGYCSKCKKLLPSKIKMDIWRLPPILVIQLKRFQYTNYSRMKLRNLVNFPIKGLDLSPWIVKDQVKNSSTDQFPTSSSSVDGGVEDGGECENKATVDGMQCEGGDVEAESATTDSEHGGSPQAYPGKDGRDESLYDLYAVVHHLGALSAGHYVASVKDKDGVWHYFNDNQVYEMDEKNLVSPSAYILFYIRCDMRGISIDDVYPAQVASGHLNLADIEAMMRQRDSAHCQVS